MKTMFGLTGSAAGAVVGLAKPNTITATNERTRDGNRPSARRGLNGQVFIDEASWVPAGMTASKRNQNDGLIWPSARMISGHRAEYCTVSEMNRTEPSPKRKFAPPVWKE